MIWSWRCGDREPEVIQRREVTTMLEEPTFEII
jgi:hypothetical protein